MSINLIFFVVVLVPNILSHSILAQKLDLTLKTTIKKYADKQLFMWKKTKRFTLYKDVAPVI